MAKNAISSYWWVPLSYTTAGESNFRDTTPKMWLPNNSDIHVIEGFPNDNEWIIFNLRASGK